MMAAKSGPEIGNRPFQKDALDEFQAVSHGIEQREVLEDFRHAGDGRGKAGGMTMGTSSRKVPTIAC